MYSSCRQHIAILLSILVLILAAPVYSACSFINGATTQTFYVSAGNIMWLEYSPDMMSAKGIGEYLKRSTITSQFGTDNNTPILSCDGSEDLMIGGSALTLKDNNYFKTDSPYYSIQHRVNNVYYPNSGMVTDVVVKQGINGEITLNELFSEDLRVSGYSASSLFTEVNIDDYKAFTIYTSDGLELMHVYVNAYYVYRKAGCTVSSTSRNVDVDMGDMYHKGDSFVGALGNEVSFTIDAYCHNTNVNIAFEADTDNNYPSVFTNPRGDGYAENVGVQIKKDNTIVTPGVPFYLETRDISQWTANKINYSFSAQLFALAGAKVPGVIDIPVTFIFSYE